MLIRPEKRNKEKRMSSLQRKNGVGPFFHPPGPAWNTGRRYTSPSPALGHTKEATKEGLGLEVGQSVRSLVKVNLQHW